METKNLKAAIDLMIDHEKRMNIIDLDLQFDLFLGNVSRWNAKKNDLLPSGAINIKLTRFDCSGMGYCKILYGFSSQSF